MVRIAIVDDNESWCFALETAFRRQNYETQAFSNPWQFLQDADEFDLAIVDYCLPAPRHQIELDGASLVKKVKEKLVHPPLLMLISSYFPDDDPMTLQSFCQEADLVLSRPRQLRTLLDLTQELLTQRSSFHSSSRSSVA